MTEETKAKISEAMKGNTNAEVWVLPLVVEILQGMIDFLMQDGEVDVLVQEESAAIRMEDGEDTGMKSIKTVVKRVKKRPHLKKQVRLEFGIYRPKWFAYIAEKYKDDESVSNLLGTIDDLCEVNTYESASNGITNANMAKMNLSQHYDWKDKIEETKKEAEKEDLSKLSTDELKQRIAKAQDLSRTTERGHKEGD